MSCSLGVFRSPVTMLCSLLTHCVADETGVITASFSFRYRLPVNGVDGAKDLLCGKMNSITIWHIRITSSIEHMKVKTKTNKKRKDCRCRGGKRSTLSLVWHVPSHITQVFSPYKWAPYGSREIWTDRTA